MESDACFTAYPGVTEKANSTPVLQIPVPNSFPAGELTPVSPDEMEQHEFFMTKALELARLAGQRGNHQVGSVLV